MASGEPTASGEDTIRERMWVERPVGTHLGLASDSDGYSPLARDDGSNAIATHVTLHADDGEADDEADEGPDLQTVVLGGLAALGVALVVKELAPHAQRLWGDHAAPALRSTWGKLARTGGDSRGASPDERAAIEVAPAVAIEDLRTAMSSAEARERFAAALMARAFSDEQLRVLRSARIVDGEGAAELECALESVTPEQVEEGTRLMLENGSLEELRHLLLLSGPEGEPLPLRLTDGRS
jgi:hypothetical protein